MLARKIATEQQPNKQSQTVVTKVRIPKSKITLGEKVLFVACAIIFTLVSVKIISNQYQVYSLNQDIQKLQSAVTEQVKVNNDLNVEVSELSRYERIWERASKLGLKLDENNVKVVQD